MPRIRTAAGDLVIGESPARAKTTERTLGRGSHVTASYGHARHANDRTVRHVSG